MPAIVGGLLAGVLLGPSALGWVGMNELLRALSELGVMFLLFGVGLEVKAGEFLRAGRTATLVAVAGVILPFLAGWSILAAAGHALTESFFMGAAMVATSVGITAQVLAEKGLLSHHTARIILAAAVIDDVLGLLVLAVVSSIGQGRGVDYAGLAVTTVVSLAFVVASARFGTSTANFVLPRLRPRLKIQEGEFAIAMIFLFAMALVAVYSGVAAIVGAFLAGMVLAETSTPRLKTLVQGAGDLLTPFFLVSIGLQLDLGALRGASTLELAAAILAAAIAAKAVGCGLGAWSLGLRDATRVGLGMVPRGEVGMVVAQVGFRSGVIGSDVYGIAVFMAVATTIMAPPLLTLAYRGVERSAPPVEGEMPDEIA
jgi:Kef-type K+ transport system membrane component KefB